MKIDRRFFSFPYWNSPIINLHRRMIALAIFTLCLALFFWIYLFFWRHWESLFIGISISIMGSLYFIALTSMRASLKQEVQRKMDELANINQLLQQEIHQRRRMEASSINSQQYLQKRHEALEYLTKLTSSELRSAIHEVILRTAIVMQVERVSVWIYEALDQSQTLSCSGLYILSTNTFSDHLKISSVQFPHYFQALLKGSHLILPSPSNENLNEELSSFFAAFNISTKLDIPIIFEGNLLGVLSCEETRGHREWLLEDRHFGQTIADIVAIMIEQSARRRAERALKQATRDAKDASAAKSEFLATISHELRTPLNAIIGFNRCLLMGVDGKVNEAQKESLKKIEKSSFLLLNLINDILDWSKIEAKKMELEIVPHNIAELTTFCVEEMLPLATKKNLTIDLILKKPLVLIEIDPMRIKQVVLNILSNAIKFTLTGSICVALADDEQFAFIQVADTGIGLSSEEIDKIFFPFTQADSSITRQYGGTGLGLVISKNIMELHGGKITVESQKGKGSIFTMILPKKQKTL